MTGPSSQAAATFMTQVALATLAVLHVDGPDPSSVTAHWLDARVLAASWVLVAPVALIARRNPGQALMTLAACVVVQVAAVMASVWRAEHAGWGTGVELLALVIPLVSVAAGSLALLVVAITRRPGESAPR